MRTSFHTQIQYNTRCHQFWVQLDRVISQLRSSYCLQTLTTLGEVRIALHPTEAVHMSTGPALVLVFRVLSKTGFEEHIDAVNLGTSVEERKVEEVPVKARHDSWFDVSDVLKETSDGGSLDRHQYRMGQELKRTTLPHRLR